VIPGKQYTPDEIVEGAWRRRWLILVPFAFILVLTMVVTHFLPDRYHSEAQLLIVPQRVPTDMVRQTVTVPLGERLQAISQEILSRTQLERIIQEFDLYPEQRKRGVIMEDIVEDMRMRDVKLGPTGASGVFSVGFDANSPKTAQAVAERLASLFIRANLEDRSNFADLTDQFLQSQLEDARRQLKAREAELETFRRENPGRMPQEYEANRQSLANTQTQLQALQESMARDRDQQLMLQRMIADASIPIAAGSGAAALSPNERQLESERERLRTLEARLKPGHPDLAIQRRTIRELEGKVADEAGRGPISAGGEVTTPAEAARKKRLAQLEDEMNISTRRLASKQGQERELLAAMSTYRQQMAQTPGVQTRMTELMRDYETLKKTYEDLLSKSQSAKVSANLERRQIGEQFKIIDPARFPQRPISPNRPRIIALGAVAGLMIGLGLAGFMEYRNTSLRTEADVVQALSLPVLAIVPTMVTAGDRVRRKKTRLVVASSGAAFLVSIVVLAWKLKLLNDWMW
jgi:polysaccharide chain length determinant protein (PEP-CTERM system associated)